MEQFQEHKDQISAYSRTGYEDEKKGDVTVTGKFGEGREGEKTGIFFCGCDADTRRIYERKKTD